MDEGLGQRLADIALGQGLPLAEDLNEVGSYKFGDLCSSVAVEHSKESDVVVAGYLQFSDVGILHVLPPALHLASGVFVVLVLGPVAGLGGDRLVQVTIPHLNISFKSNSKQQRRQISNSQPDPQYLTPLMIMYVNEMF